MFSPSLSSVSLASRVASLSSQDRQEILRGLTKDQLFRLKYNWRFWAREKQLPPPGMWATWAVIAGRGFGKTRTGSEWFHSRMMGWKGRWGALVAKTPKDARDFMIEGPGGLLKSAPPWEFPEYEPSKVRITWPNGSWATIYSDEQPDQLRGFSGDTAWFDEFAKFRNPKDCWENLNFGMREASNDRPRRLITTTPRPIKLLKEILALDTTIVTTGTSHENRENLDPTWYNETVLAYEKTRIGRQEIMAQILSDMPGALWTTQLIEDHRVPGRNSQVQSLAAWREEWKWKLDRIVVAMDPAAGSGDQDSDRKAAKKKGGAEHGIIVAGWMKDGHGYILEDHSERCSPLAACKKLVQLYDAWEADKIIGEVNNGGDWIGTTVQQTAKTMGLMGERKSGSVNYGAVHASRGKATRAEPISALDERGLIHHVGLHPELEDQMTTWDPKEVGPSPDRMDARVWALTELMIGNGKKGGVLW